MLAAEKPTAPRPYNSKPTHHTPACTHASAALMTMPSIANTARNRLRPPPQSAMAPSTGAATATKMLEAASAMLNQNCESRADMSAVNTL